jgi:phosphoglycolate phosphatase-like HAD superfamily hydrolase
MGGVRQVNTGASVPVVVLFDLDATLFDYSALRAQATRTALEGIVDDPEKISEELSHVLRPPLTDLLFGLGLPNLRQKWDSPEVFAVARILANPSLRKDFEDTAEAARILSSSGGMPGFRRTFELARTLDQIKSTQSFVRSVREIVAGSDQGSFRTQRKIFVEYVEKEAVLANGAKDIISRLTDLNAEVHVVSEGDSEIQGFKFASLRLRPLVPSCIVTDSTCNVGQVLRELCDIFRGREEVPTPVAELSDLLEQYSIKSAPFFVKLFHGLADRSGSSLEERMRSPRFLTAKEWDEGRGPRVVMIGDRYDKDIEPALSASASGVRAFRILTGRYAKEFPLHELIAEGRRLPHGVFADLRYLCEPLAGLVREFHEPMRRPEPILPSPELVESVIRMCPSLSKETTRILLELKSEALRQREAQ